MATPIPTATLLYREHPEYARRSITGYRPPSAQPATTASATNSERSPEATTTTPKKQSRSSS